MTTVQNRKSKLPPTQKLTHDPVKWSPSFLCSNCPDLERCGGVANQVGGHCYMHCCGGKLNCDTVCRCNPEFPAQIKEILGFDLTNVPRTIPLADRPISGMTPLLIHGKGRKRPFVSENIAVKLRSVVDMRRGTIKYRSREELAAAFQFDPSAKVVLTGIDQDKWVEPWWSMGRDKRCQLLDELTDFGIDLVAPPNFSLFCDQPRPNDFSAMKRIALVQAEFLAAGIPCALHPHVTTDNDSKRWSEFVSSRPEIRTISYEFTTGAGRPVVRKRHINHLANLALAAKRPLDLILHGDQKVVAELAKFYRNIIYINTNIFMKSIHRCKAVRTTNKDLGWRSVITPDEISVESLLQHNHHEEFERYRLLLSRA